MKIDEAIELLTCAKEGFPANNTEPYYKAIELGIEALKRHKHNGDYLWTGFRQTPAWRDSGEKGHKMTIKEEAKKLLAQLRAKLDSAAYKIRWRQIPVDSCADAILSILSDNGMGFRGEKVKLKAVPKQLFKGQDFTHPEKLSYLSGWKDCTDAQYSQGFISLKELGVK